jgi:hypothetical protein
VHDRHSRGARVCSEVFEKLACPSRRLLRKAIARAHDSHACCALAACASTQAAISGLNGFTTGEKLEKMGRDPTAMVNSTAYVPPEAEAETQAE